MKIKNVAVIGAGLRGLRLAALISRAGFETVLEDVLPSNLRRAESNLSNGANSLAGNSGSLRFASSVEDAVRFADLVVDGVPDELESKLEIFSLLDRMAPPLAIFVTPTRALSIADLASCTYRAERCLAVQFASDELASGETVVLVSTSKTSEEVKEAVAEFWTSLGLRVESQRDPLEASVIAGTLF